MPYKVVKVTGGYKVKTIKPGRPKYHSKNPMTKTMADKQARALYRVEGMKSK